MTPLLLLMLAFPADDPPKFLNLKQVLSLLHFSRATLKRLVRHEIFPHGIKFTPRITLWRADLVAKYIEEAHCSPVERSRG